MTSRNEGTYDYKKVICTCCGWRGRRGYRIGWLACPSCHANAKNIVFANPEELIGKQLSYHHKQQHLG
jgi:hypothetical protein